MKTQFETIGGYPTVFATNEEKATKEYGLQYLKRMYYDYKSNTDLSYQDRKRQYEKMRAYAEGTQSVSKYKDILDVEGDTSYMNIDWTPVCIVPKFVDVISGGMFNQEFKVRANGVDKLSIDQRDDKARGLFADMKTAPLRASMSKITGQDFTKKGFVPESIQELQVYMDMHFKLAQEISLENGIEYVLQNNDFSETRKRIIRDLVVIGTAAVKTYIDASHGIKIKYVNPTQLITSYSDSPSYKNINHAGEIYTISISELKRIAGDEFTEDEYKEIAEKYGKKVDDDTLYGKSFSNSGDYSNEYDKFSVEIMDAEFISTYELNYEKKENAFGGFSLRKKEGKYKTPKNSKYKREKVSSTVKAVYSGKYIVGSDYIFNYGLAKNMSRPKNNLAETKLSYTIYSPNLNKMRNVSMVQRMIPFADQIQLAHLKMQQVMAKARPKGAAFEIGSLENVSKGDGGTFTPLELQEIFDQTGNIYYRRTDDEGNATNAFPVQELENGIGRDMMQLIQIYQHNLNMIRDVTGVNEARDGAKPSSDALVGIQKMQLMASNNATRSVNDGYLKIIEDTGESICLKLQDIVKYDKPFSGYMKALGQAVMKTVNLNKDISLHEFGIDIQVEPDEEERAQLEQSIQLSLAQKELRLEDAIIIRDINNVKLANRMLILRRKKYQKEQMAIAQQQIQANSQQQQQSAQVTAQLKQGEMNMQSQLDAKMKQLDAELEIRKMQIEFEMKNQYEQAAHQRELEKIQINNLGKIEANRTQGKSREKTVAKSAHFQSKMIEQRKGNEAPIEDPDIMM
tara:strand:- start:1266 stop:3653 length:2388 start_codon:yes stop_codon:yes gene_type:complete